MTALRYDRLVNSELSHGKEDDQKTKVAEAALLKLHEDHPTGVGTEMSAGARVGSSALKQDPVWTCSAESQASGCGHIRRGVTTT